MDLTVKVPVVECDDYIMYIEWLGNAPYFHTDVHRWSAEIKKSYLDDLDNLQRQLPVPLIAISKVENQKLIKFGRSIGFKYEAEWTDNNGTPYHIYSRRL